VKGSVLLFLKEGGESFHRRSLSIHVQALCTERFS
jgi:hypothetical protein